MLNAGRGNGQGEKGRTDEEGTPGGAVPAARPGFARPLETARARVGAAALGAGRRPGPPAAPANSRRTGLEAAVAGARAGVRGARGRRPVRRFHPASGRAHAVPGAGASPGLRQRHPLLGILLRRPLVADACPDRRGPEAVRRRRPRPAGLVRRRGQAGVLRDLPGDPGRDVFLRAPALRRDRGAGGAAGRGLLVRAGRFRPQAADRIHGHRGADGAARTLRTPVPAQAGDGLAGGPAGGPGGGDPDAVRAARPRAPRPVLPARREGCGADAARTDDRFLKEGRDAGCGCNAGRGRNTGKG